MKIAIYSVTNQGDKLSQKLFKLLDYEVEVFSSEEIKNLSLSRILERSFFNFDAHIFIMALGIVIRSIAKFIRSKYTDPAVIVLDEIGKNVISVLSGHLGGANKLTYEIAEKLLANPVITTATDILKIKSIEALSFGIPITVPNLSVQVSFPSLRVKIKAPPSV